MERRGERNRETVVMRRFLERISGTTAVGEDAPVLLTATPAGEGHALGAFLSALSGAAWGWMGVYPGPDLPGKEIAKEAWRAEAEAVRPVCIDPRTADDLLLEIEKA